MTMSHDQTASPMTIRVVFDGAPFAGKTTAAHALSEALGSHVSSPEEDAGRTLWFDWMTYSAGHHEGRPIRIELVTVPGQLQLADRRRHLIEWGDVIVFMANTSEAVFADSVARFHHLRSELAELGGKPIVTIANKRDLMDAAPIDAVRTQLGLTESDVLIEGVATAGGGIRTAFIHAVRAGLAESADRIDAMTGEELLAEMQAALATEPLEPAALSPDAGSGDPAAPPPPPLAVRNHADQGPAEPAPLAPPLPQTAAADIPAPDPIDDEADPMHRALHLNPEAIAEGDAVVILARHWRTLVSVATRGTTDDEATVDELAAWGLLVDDGMAEPELPSDHTEVPYVDADHSYDATAAPPISTLEPHPLAAEPAAAAVRF